MKILKEYVLQEILLVVLEVVILISPFLNFREVAARVHARFLKLVRKKWTA